MKMKVRERREPPKKQFITFKATPLIAEEEEFMDEGAEEDFALLLREVGKKIYKK